MLGTITNTWNLFTTKAAFEVIQAMRARVRRPRRRRYSTRALFLAVINPGIDVVPSALTRTPLRLTASIIRPLNMKI